MYYWVSKNFHFQGFFTQKVCKCKQNKHSHFIFSPPPLPSSSASHPVSSPTLPRFSQKYPPDGLNTEDIPAGILKNTSELAQTVPCSVDTKVKSILKQDSNGGPQLKSDLSYEAVSSSSSNEDLARSFPGVIIDPLPGLGRRSAPETPLKKPAPRPGQGPSPNIPPHSLNISADGDLASKLARLAGEADCIKQKLSDR